MADRHKTRNKLRISDADYDYIYKVAARLKRQGSDPNCTAALRRIIAEHRRYCGREKWGTTPCAEVTVQ
jgi:hypothetical protein